jgi:hypothetical protein
MKIVSLLHSLLKEIQEWIAGDLADPTAFVVRRLPTDPTRTQWQ